VNVKDFEPKLRTSIAKVERWVEEHDYKSYEPFDGLSSYLGPLTVRSTLLQRLLQQLVRQSPVNLRPLLGVRPQESTKGRGYMAWGYVKMLGITKDRLYEEKARACLDWLDKNKAPGFATHSWANHFDFASRGGRTPKHQPIIVWTSLIGQAYLDAYEALGDPRYLDIAKSVCAWILAVPRERTPRGACLSYVAGGQSSIHNSNMLGAAMLARSSRYFGPAPYLEVAKEAMEYSCSRQLPDGAWYYGEAENLHWIDNFHTGYNLDSLKIYNESSQDTAYADNLKKGIDFYVEHFIEPNGRPKYYHNRAYPIDSQCISQTIDTLANFADLDGRTLELAVKVANWAIDEMQGRDGHFFYRQYPLMKVRTPMLHWAQATTYKALTLLLGSIRRSA
jgi:rhamnogalacturonyl hydrolase YesR